MALRILEISAPDSHYTEIRDAAEAHGALDQWHSSKNKDGRRTLSVLIHLDNQQELLDELQKFFHNKEKWRIVVLPVEATIPKQPEPEHPKDAPPVQKFLGGSISREELYNEVERGAALDANFALLVFLSTIVCAIGLIKSNVAVVIGAMVIAPLLGPNLAFSFGIAVGDRSMIFKAAKANAAGIALTFILSTIAGLLFTFPIVGTELTSRTEVGFDSIALALASGAAAVLSLTTGLSSTLVGVMVAVALMPPAVTLGLMLGMGHLAYAYGAGLLLLANVASLNLAAQMVFLMKGIQPRTWYKQKKSRQSVNLTMT